MAEPTLPADAPPPTRIRYLVVAVTAGAALFMYVDRVCLAQLKADIQAELNLSELDMDWALSAFFWPYALAQVPAAALGVRLGLRRTLAILLVAWSAFTAVGGLATGLMGLFLARLAVGLAEAGAYPTAAALVKGWFPLAGRGRASSTVALGGRAGQVLGLFLTPILAGMLADAGFDGWRVLLIAFGVAGMAWAGVFWAAVRDTPRDHPWANTAEVAHAGPPPPAAAPLPGLGLLSILAQDRNLWFYSLTQLGNNIAWAFLITKLPDLLRERYHVAAVEKGTLAAIPPLGSCLGMFAGGFLTDALTRRLGLRWGRALPVGGMLLVAGAAYLACLWVQDRWLVMGLLALMAVAVDVGMPAIWAFSQDVGGRHTGAVLGWGNMFGNLGAGLSPLLLGRVKEHWGWDGVFLTCAGCFAVAAAAALNLDATRPVFKDTAGAQNAPPPA